MKKTQDKKKSNSVRKRLNIYIAISVITLLIILPLTCLVFCTNDNSLQWINIFIDVLLAFFSGSIFAIVVDIIPFYAEKSSVKKSLKSLIDSCLSELNSIENYDTKQSALDKYYEIFRDFFFVQSNIMGETAFECLKELDNVKLNKISSIEPGLSNQHLDNFENILKNWLTLI